MSLYIPFIHKVSKKEKNKPTQIPLQIEQLPVPPEKKGKEEQQGTIVIIELF